MADYYLDLNGTAAGYGTLTANVNAANVWGLNSTTGTVAPVTRTFSGNADTMNFGSSSVGSTTSGTLTLNVVASVNGIRTANLTGEQVIAGPSVLTLSRSGATPFIDCGTGGLAITAPIAGTQGFDYTGTTNLGIKANSSISGVISGRSTAGLLIVTPASGSSLDLLQSATRVDTALLLLPVIPAGVTTYTWTPPVGKVSGAARGRLQVNPSDATGTVTGTINGSLAALTGTTVTSPGTNSADPSDGFAVFRSASTGTTAVHNVTLNNEMPEALTFYPQGASTTSSISVTYAGSSGIKPTKLQVGACNGASTSWALTFNSNQSGALELQGGIYSYGLAQNATLTLSGTSASSTTVSGAVTQYTGCTLILVKTGTNRYIFTNATNNYSGGTSLNAGVIQITQSAGFGTGVVTVASGAAAELAGSGITAANNLSLAGSGILSTGALLNVSGNNTVSGTVALTAAATIGSDSGTLTASNVISGGFALTTAGAGVIALTNTANTFSGTATLGSSTTTITALANGGSNSSLGAGSSAIVLSSGKKLQYNGTTGTSTNRGLTISGGSGAFAATLETANVRSAIYSGTLSYSSVSAGSVCSLTLAGTQAAGRYLDGSRFSMAVGNPASATTKIVKDGTGAWWMTETTTNTGDTDVNAGTLFGVHDSATPSARFGGGKVNLNSGGTIRTATGTLQLGRMSYPAGLKLNGGTVHIGGSSSTVTVQMTDNLTVPTGADKTNFDLSADAFKSPGTYALIEFVGAAGLVGSTANIQAVNLPAAPSGAARSASFNYSSPGGGVPNTLFVTIS